LRDHYDFLLVGIKEIEPRSAAERESNIALLSQAVELSADALDLGLHLWVPFEPAIARAIEHDHSVPHISLLLCSHFSFLQVMSYTITIVQDENSASYDRWLADGKDWASATDQVPCTR
jgi:hypothetical protein